MPRLRPTLIAAAIAAFVLPAGAARAATVTIGSDLTNAGSEVNLCAAGFDCVYYQTLAGTPVAVAPFDGTISTWRLKAGSTSGQVTLRVLQPGPGSTVTAVRRSATETVNSTGTNTFPTNLSIDKGQIIALDNASSGLYFAPAASNFVVNYFQAATAGPDALPDGTSGTPNHSTSSLELLLNADVTQDTVDLAITKDGTPNPVGVGQTLTYLLTITNNGPKLARAVTVADTLPSGVTFVSATRSTGTCSGTTTVNCDLGRMLPGATETVSIAVTPNAAGTLTNTATVSTTTSDTNTGNDSATTTTTVTATPQPTPPPTLKMLKVSPRRFRAGSALPKLAVRPKAPVGTTISYLVTDATTVRLTFERVLPGRQVGKRCLPATKARAKKRRCKRYVRRGSLPGPAQTGIHRIKFAGRLSRTRRLAPGSYRLTATARAGTKTARARALFTLLKH